MAEPSGATRSFTPNDKWELGIHAGVPFISGDIDSKFPGFGGGLHLRKAFDHIFSFRLVGLYAQVENENETTAAALKTSETTWISGTAQVVATLNNFRFNKPYKKVLVNAFMGVGVNNFSTDYRGVVEQTGGQPQAGTSEGTNAHLDFGAGLQFRINSRFNIGLEHTVTSVLGKNSDLLDGDQNVGVDRTTFADFFHYPHVSLNFNLGGADRSEPLYWVNPLTQVADAIAALEARPIYDPTDTDADGIIDAIDEEDNSPAGARVDTKGNTMDSDNDKVPDYQDKEPFSPPGYTVNSEGVADVPKPITEADVNRIVDAKLAAFKVPSGGFGFLPNVNFALNSYDIPYGEYEKLYYVASVLKQDANRKIVVTGHADKTGPADYNNVLSYNRAKAVVEFLAVEHMVDRSRLVLNYKGEESSIIPVNGANRVNRRVDFAPANAETEMARPAGPEAGRGRFRGNKDAGY
jgi:OOP family OmpA-OmpF porin